MMADAIVTVQIKIGLSLWDALKLRIAGAEVRRVIIARLQAVIDKAASK